MQRRFLWVLPLLLLVDCSPEQRSSTDGLSLHQSVTVAPERRLEVWEDGRITPALREAMWGGSKTLPDGSTPRRGLLRLIDLDGHVLAERRLDCELGEIAEPAIPQGADGHVWGVGDDCSTGEGEFAGLVTRFLPPPGDKIQFEHYDGDRSQELTLVTSRRFAWHTAPRGIADLVHEISSHPDFDDPRFKALKQGENPPPDLPWVVEYLTYRWDASARLWHRTTRIERNRRWQADEVFPGDAAFPAEASSEG